MEKYEKQWSSAEPGLMIFLIDQSESMKLPWENQTRAVQTANILNRVLYEIILKNMDGTEPKPRVFITLIGYGGSGGNSVDLLGKGTLPEFAKKSIRLEKRKQKVMDGNGGVIDIDIEMPIWLDPVANGLTPMAGAFETAKDVIRKWLENRPSNPAPIIINITDGMAYNGNKSNEFEERDNTYKAYDEVMKLKTSNGEEPLVFNAHIGGENKKIGFPEEEAEVGSDEMAKFLFKISSIVPDAIKKNADPSKLNFAIKDNSKAFIANADVVDLAEFINFGSDQALRDKN